MIGKKLAHYEITSQIGKGGMGEVYQAKDTKLGRDVAIKVLPEEFAFDPNRVTRFQREAKLLASLNHPNIAAIHGLEESDDTHFLVMELIPGDTLADRIKAGAIPVEESLKLALQITEALEAAHEKGVIHRDLKPANIKVTPEGKVKVLDFGLAKAFTGDETDVNLTDSPTLSEAATRQGVILGTAAYMSPEQARGKAVDKRADIWAFGVVLYEMLAGKALFAGEDITSTLARVLERKPDFSTLPDNLHYRVRLLLERCLKKEPKNRYSGINDARVDIQEVLADPEGANTWQVSGMESRSRQRSTTTWAALTVFLIAVSGAIGWYLKPSPPPEPKRVMRFTYELPEGQLFNRGEDGGFDIHLAVSPDGERFVYGTTEGLYLRSMDTLDATLISGTDGFSGQPQFSPDGQWICYWSASEKKLKKVAVGGGAAAVLCDTGIAVNGISWEPDNSILYSDIMNGGIKRISANSGTPEILIKEDLTGIAKKEGNGYPVFPGLLPDGKTLLFTRAWSTNPADWQMVAQSLESGDCKSLVEGAIAGRYLPNGHLLYALYESNALDVSDLIAVPFNPETLEVTGGQVLLFEGLSAGAVSQSGTLIYVSRPADTAGSAGQTASDADSLVWVDLEGHEDPIGAPPNIYKNPRISPDGMKVAIYFVSGSNQDIWVWDFVRETMSRLTTSEANDLTPLWTPDGRKIAFCSMREAAAANGGIGGIFLKAADGTGEVEFLGSVKNRMIFPGTWSADGKSLVAAEYDLSGAGSLSSPHFEISMFSMEGDHERAPLIEGNFTQSFPRISPDGKWIAYSSDKSGRHEVYVRPFPDVNKEWLVSNSGGSCPLWSPDGKKLYYIAGGDAVEAVMEVAVETESVFNPGKPRLLFHGRYRGPGEQGGGGAPWDIHPDGKRFLMIKPPGVDTEATQDQKPEAPKPQPKIHIVVNWFEELKELVPVE